jgi:serine O-acetyltransferase
MFENLREDYKVYANLTGVGEIKGIPAASRIHDARRFLAALWMFPLSAVLLYRLKCWLRVHHIPLVPRVCDWVNMLVWRVQIADNVSIGPGLCISHGDVMIAGEVSIGRDCTLNPWSGIGLLHRRRVAHPWERLVGPTLGDNVFVGVGSLLLGPITVGDNVRIGANSVVIRDVPDDTVVAGNPARPLDLDDSELGLSAQGDEAD